jgi:hypothetical protein
MIRVALIFLLFLPFSMGFSQSIKFDGVEEGAPIKRGKQYLMYWEGNLTSQIVSVQFRKNDLVVHEGPGFLKSGKYHVPIPNYLTVDNYTILVVDPSTQAVLKSDQIKIKRRIPLVAHVAIGIIGFTCLAFLIPS